MTDTTNWNEYWTSRPTADEFYPTSSRLQSVLERWVHEGSAVLEVGCGTGRDSIALRKSGARPILLDKSDKALELACAQRSDLRGDAVVRGDGLQKPFPNDCFDVVFHQGLMEHFREPWQLLSEDRRVLKPGGLLIVDVPQALHAWTLVKKLLIPMGLWPQGWETQYTPRGLEQLMERAGFDVVQSYGDWMRPSLAYRLGRFVLLRLGVRLPQYPRGIPILRDLRRELRHLAYRRRWPLYTTFTIGVVAGKPVRS